MKTPFLKRRLGAYLGLLLAVALVAAACGPAETETTSAAPDAPAATDAAPDVAPPPTVEMDTAPEAGPLGQVIVPAGDKIQIRNSEVLSGGAAFLGISDFWGVQLALQDYTDVKGFEINLGVQMDDLCSAEGGQASAQAVVADPQVVGMIGTSCSGAAGGALPLISEAGYVMISGANTSPALTSDLAGTAGDLWAPGYYRTSHNDLFQGRALADFLFQEKGIKTAAFIHDGDPYTDGLATAARDAFVAQGGVETLYTAVNKGDTDLVPLLTEIAASTPDAIVFPIFMPESGFLIQQIGGIAGLEDVFLITTDASLASNFVELPESEGVYLSGPDERYGQNTNDFTGAVAEDVRERYIALAGETPSAAFWAHAYDATTMLLEAIDIVSVVFDGDLYIDRQALRDALTAMSFNGLIGAIACDDFGDCSSNKIAIMFNETTGDLDATRANLVYAFAGE